jgi:hypothetical protein
MLERASAEAASLRGRFRANTGEGGGKARNTGARERNLSITIKRIGRGRGSSTARRPKVVSDMQAKNEKLIIADLVGSARRLGTITGPRKRPGEPMRMEVTEAGGPSILSKVVSVPVVQGGEDKCVGGWEGVVGESTTHTT